jgi:hypothetical protein
MSMSGVIRIWILPYELDVILAELFTWTKPEDGKTMEDKVIAAFQAAFGPDIVVSRK